MILEDLKVGLLLLVHSFKGLIFSRILAPYEDLLGGQRMTRPLSDLCRSVGGLARLELRRPLVLPLSLAGGL